MRPIRTFPGMPKPQSRYFSGCPSPTPISRLDSDVDFATPHPERDQPGTTPASTNCSVRSPAAPRAVAPWDCCWGDRWRCWGWPRRRPRKAKARVRARVEEKARVGPHPRPRRPIPTPVPPAPVLAPPAAPWRGAAQRVHVPALVQGTRDQGLAALTPNHLFALTAPAPTPGCGASRIVVGLESVSCRALDPVYPPLTSLGPGSPNSLQLLWRAGRT